MSSLALLIVLAGPAGGPLNAAERGDLRGKPCEPFIRVLEEAILDEDLSEGEMGVTSSLLESLKRPKSMKATDWDRCIALFRRDQRARFKDGEAEDEDDGLAETFVVTATPSATPTPKATHGLTMVVRALKPMSPAPAWADGVPIPAGSVLTSASKTWRSPPGRRYEFAVDSADGDEFEDLADFLVERFEAAGFRVSETFGEHKWQQWFELHAYAPGKYPRYTVRATSGIALTARVVASVTVDVQTQSAWLPLEGVPAPTPPPSLPPLPPTSAIVDVVPSSSTRFTVRASTKETYEGVLAFYEKAPAPKLTRSPDVSTTTDDAPAPMTLRATTLKTGGSHPVTIEVSEQPGFVALKIEYSLPFRYESSTWECERISRGRVTALGEWSFLAGGVCGQTLAPKGTTPLTETCTWAKGEGNVTVKLRAENGDETLWELRGRGSDELSGPRKINGAPVDNVLCIRRVAH